MRLAAKGLEPCPFFFVGVNQDELAAVMEDSARVEVALAMPRIERRRRHIEFACQLTHSLGVHSFAWRGRSLVVGMV